MCDNYLKRAFQYLENECMIFHQAERVVFENITCTKIWKNIATEVMKTECKVHTAKGGQSIVCHVDCAESGFLGNCLLDFEVQSQISFQITTQK